MADKFLNNGGGQNANVSDGSTNIYGATIGADNLNPFTPVKTNSQNQLVSTNLEISDVNNLQATLNTVITNPYTGASLNSSNGFESISGAKVLNLKNNLIELKDASSKNYQNSFSIEISDETVANLKTSITKSELNIIADAIVESTLDASNLHFVAVNGDAIFGYDGLVFAEPLILIPRMELVPDFLKFTSTDGKYISEYNTKFLELKTNNTIVDLPYMKLEADLVVGGIENTITSYKDFIINKAGNQRLLINDDKVEYKDATGFVTSDYRSSGLQIKNVSNRNIQTASTIEINDQVNNAISIFLTKTSLDISNPTDKNAQTASLIEISDEKTANIKSTLTKTALKIVNSGNSTECEITAPQIYMSNIGDTHRLSISKDLLNFIDTSVNSNVINPTSYSLYQTGNLITPVSQLNQTNLILRTTSITPEILTLSNNSVTFNSPINNTANSLSNTQLSMIDSSLNRSLLTRTALQLFSPVSNTIPTSSLNQTSLVLRTTSLSPEIATLTNNDLILTSPINSCVASFSSSTLVMNDLAITHGTTINKDEFSAIDASQYVSRLNANSLRIFKPTDLVNPATLLNEEKLVIIDGNDKTTLDTLKVKVENTLSGQNCQLLSTGLVGSGIDIFPDVGTNISLAVSAGGYIIITGLPTSNAGLPSGALYTHIQGGHTLIAIVP